MLSTQVEEVLLASTYACTSGSLAQSEAIRPGNMRKFLYSLSLSLLAWPGQRQPLQAARFLKPSSPPRAPDHAKRAGFVCMPLRQTASLIAADSLPMASERNIHTFITILLVMIGACCKETGRTNHATGTSCLEDTNASEQV